MPFEEHYFTSANFSSTELIIFNAHAFFWETELVFMLRPLVENQTAVRINQVNDFLLLRMGVRTKAPAGSAQEFFYSFPRVSRITPRSRRLVFDQRHNSQEVKKTKSNGVPFEEHYFTSANFSSTELIIFNAHAFFWETELVFMLRPLVENQTAAVSIKLQDAIKLFLNALSYE